MNKIVYGFIILLFIGSCVGTKLTKEQFNSITYTKGPVAADRGSHSFISIVKTGKDSLLVLKGKKYSFVSKQTGDYIKKTDTLSLKMLDIKYLDELLGVINDKSFLNLSTKYRDPKITDGSYERIHLTGDEIDKKVVVANTRKKRFDKVVEEIDRISELAK